MKSTKEQLIELTEATVERATNLVIALSREVREKEEIYLEAQSRLNAVRAVLSEITNVSVIVSSPHIKIGE